MKKMIFLLTILSLSLPALARTKKAWQCRASCFSISFENEYYEKRGDVVGRAKKRHQAYDQALAQCEERAGHYATLVRKPFRFTLNTQSETTHHPHWWGRYHYHITHSSTKKTLHFVEAIEKDGKTCTKIELDEEELEEYFEHPEALG